MERAIAIVLIVFVWLCLATRRSLYVWVWNYSKGLSLALVCGAILGALFVASYRFAIPRALEAARSLLVASGFSLLVAGIVTEGVLAWIDPPRPDPPDAKVMGHLLSDPELGHVFRPNFEMHVQTAESASLFRTNSLGIRADREYGPKPANVRRLIALGDSFTVSVNVPAPQTWPGVLEQLLNDAAGGATRFELVNAGHGGWGTMQESKWLAKYGDEFAPDAVLLAMTPNDVFDNMQPPPGGFTVVKGRLARAGSGERQLAVYEHDQRLYSLPGWWKRSHLLQRIDQLRRKEPPPLPFLQVAPDAKVQRGNALTEGFLRDIHAWTRARQIPFGIAIVTFRAQLSPLPGGYEASAFGKRWSEFARREGIAVFDTYPVVRGQADPQALYWKRDDHYAPPGCRMLGEAAFALARPWFFGASPTGEN